MFFSVLCLLCLCIRLFICTLVTCWEGADLLALGCGANCEFFYLPIGILGQVWYLIVLIPDLFTLTHFVAFRPILYVLSTNI